MTTKINLLAVSLFLPVFIFAQNVIPEPAQYRPAKGEFVLSIAENRHLRQIMYFRHEWYSVLYRIVLRGLMRLIVWRYLPILFLFNRLL